MNTVKPRFQIRFPSLLLIPTFSIIGSILRTFDLTHYDWFHVIITIPIAIYFIWCIGYCAIVMLAIWMYRVIKGN